MPRADGRANDELRPVKMSTGYNKYAEGSCLVELGDTVVICTASVRNEVPRFLVGTQRGWVTAEYGMLPRATNTRTMCPRRTAARVRPLSPERMSVWRRRFADCRRRACSRKCRSSTRWLQ